MLYICGKNRIHVPDVCDSGCYFTGLTVITITQGADVDLTSGVSAYNGDDELIAFTVSALDTCEVGTHQVLYTSACGEAYRTVIIEQSDDPTITGLTPITIETGTDFDPLNGVEATAWDGGEITPTVSYETVRTVLYADGTLIINELGQDSASNEAYHGSVVKVYEAFGVNDYVFVLDGYTPTTLWYAERDMITSVEFGSIVKPTHMDYWFYGCQNNLTFDWTNLDTSQCTSMNSTFSGCIALVSLDLSSFDTRNVTNMYNMFGSCTSLQNLNVSNFDTSQVTNMQWMFESCKQLAALHLSNFDTSSVTNMGGMFGFCEQLIALDLSNFDTSSATSMDGMFDNCISLQDLDVSSFDTSNVLYMNKMFYKCESLEELYLPLFDSSSVTDVLLIFSHCSALTTIYTTSAFDLSGVSLSYSAFYNCTSLIGGNGTVYNSAHVDGAYGRIDASGTPGYFTAIS